MAHNLHVSLLSKNLDQKSEEIVLINLAVGYYKLVQTFIS